MDGVSRPAANAMLDQAQAPPGAQPLLQGIGITKRYGNFLANDHIDLDLHPAQIHALLGENGAGKSTFVKIAYGLIQPNEGELRWLGRKVVLRSEERRVGKEGRVG